MTNGADEALARARARLLGEVRVALGRARGLMRDLRGDDTSTGDSDELERLARRTDLLLAELEALGAANSAGSDAVMAAQSSSSSSSSSGSSVA